VPLNDAYLQISAAENATHFDWNIGSTYTGAGFAGASPFDPSTDLPLRFGTLPNPNVAQDYTIRVFDGGNVCVTDITVTIEQQDCMTGCDCQEIIYLNEPVIGAVLKFIINPDGSLTEIQGANGGDYWYPDNLGSELPDPHGLATDINGFLYIGANFTPNNPIRKFTCDGTIFPETNETITHPYVLTNMFSVENTLYTTKGGGMASFDLCSGEELGTLCYNDINGNMTSQANSTQNVYWGLSYNSDTETVYATGVQNNNQGAQGIWVFTFDELEAAFASGDCIDPFVWEDDTMTSLDLNIGDSFLPNDLDRLNGIVSDDAGNIYISGWYEPSDLGFIYKYDASGGFITQTDSIFSVELSRGIIWSEETNNLYLANQSDDIAVDCISTFDADDLSYTGTAAANPNLPANNAGKAMATIKECCPVINRQNIDISICVVDPTEPIFIAEIYECEGIVCEGNWDVLGILDPVIVYDECSQSVNLTGPNQLGGAGGSACATFINESAGDSSTDQCGAYEIILNVQFVLIPEVTFTDTEVCAGQDLELTPQFNFVDLGANYDYRWQISQSDCNGPFTNIAGENGSTLTVSPTSETTYRMIIDLAVGCITGVCSDTTCVTVSTLDSPLADAGESVMINCDNPIVVLTGSGSSGSTYNWMTSNGNIVSGGNTMSPSVDVAGTYTLVTELSNGCTSSPSSVTVTGEACCSMGGSVFLDNDNSGCRDALDEVGVGGFDVSLFLCDAGGNPTGVALATTLTDSDGSYLFETQTCLSPSNEYIVQFDFPSNGTFNDYVFSSNAATGACPSGSEVDVDAMGLSACFSPGGDDDDIHIDAGILLCGSISGTVFFDNDNSGCQDGFDESIVSGFDVFLHQCDAAGNPNATPIASTTTDSFGNYRFFTNGPGGTQSCLNPSLSYTVSFGFPADGSLDAFTFSTTESTTCNAGFADDINPNTGFANACYSVGTDPGTTHINAGIFGCESITGLVFYDNNNNGCQDIGESAITEVVSVNLYECDSSGSEIVGGVLASTTTSNGAYEFSAVTNDPNAFVCINPTSRYLVEFMLPNGGGMSLDGYVFTNTVADATCTASGNADDVNPDNGFSSCITANGMTDEDEHVNAGIGFFDLALIGQVVSPGPYQIGDLIDFQITVFNQGTIDATDITINDYLPSGLTFDPALNPGWNDGGALLTFLLSDLPAGGQTTIDLVLTLGSVSTLEETLNFTEIASAFDGNGDPANDIDSAYGSNTAQEQSVLPGSTNDNNINGGGLALGQDEDDHDPSGSIGLTGCLSNRIWQDCNANGLQDIGEAGFEGITVFLFNTNNVLIESAVTDFSGTYIFDDLQSGQYYVQVVIPDSWDTTTPNVGNNESADSDITGANGLGTTPFFFVESGDECGGDTQNDGGLYQCAEIGESVWYDANGNNVQDIGENGVNGVRVELFRLGEDGQYDFYDAVFTGHKPGTPSDDGYWKVCVPPGTYYVRYDVPSVGLSFVLANVGSDLTDSDVTDNFGYGTTSAFSVDCGEEKCDIGAGLEPMSTFGDRVWYDANQNGQLDLSEDGIEGIQVKVYNADGDLVKETVTDIDGSYAVDYLQERAYFVEFVPPSGFTPTVPNNGDETIDSDIDHTHGLNTTQQFEMQSGVHINTIDAGFVANVILSNLYLSINAERADSDNHIHWSVGNDDNVISYNIQKRMDNTFETIGSLDPNQASSPYLFIDDDARANGLYAYRVVATKTNGDQEVSDIVTVLVGGSDNSVVEVYPNPAKEEITITITNPKAGSLAHMSIKDIAGKVYREKEILADNLSEGQHQFPVLLGEVPQGFYLIQIVLDDIEYTEQVLILN
jgi:uncharacterized repeat protein (TIGR01451 family)